MSIIQSELGVFEGKPVTRTAIKLTKAGDGLSEALKIDPQLLHMGDTLYVVVECAVADVNFKPTKDDPDLVTRVHSLVAGTAVIVDPDLVQDMVEAQREKNLRAREAAQGVKRLPGHGDLDSDHDAGLHDDMPEPGCPQCEGAVKGETPTAAPKKSGKGKAQAPQPTPEQGAETSPGGKRKRPSRAEVRAAADVPPSAYPENADQADPDDWTA